MDDIVEIHIFRVSPSSCFSRNHINRLVCNGGAVFHLAFRKDIKYSCNLLF